MWARKRIDELSGYPFHQSPGELTGRAREAVVALALRHRILTAYTSFVAVEERQEARPDGTLHTVQVPVEGPHGVSMDASENPGLGSLGLHLLDERAPLGKPRTVVTPDPALLEALAGDYKLENGMRMQLRPGPDGLHVDVAGQGEITMQLDSAGDFFPPNFDALLRPQRQADGRYAFTWLQGGGAMPAKREDADAGGKPAVAAPTAEALKAYEGVFRIAPPFAITVFAKDGKLFAQGTNQGALEIAYAGGDVFVAEKVGAEMEFQRNAAGQVEAMLLKQGGAVQKAVKE